MENDTVRKNDNDIETEGATSEGNSVFDDDSLDDAVSAAGDTGMISQQQFVIKTEEEEHLPHD
ncbi:MAG: hypothetical protein M3126_05190 [Candidatus Eremiobacteraeota bacterium]|nr:hypothetical protein [Candidatus Eremiobacteraeota bacterium]